MTTAAQRLGPACQEARDGLVSDPVGLERVEQHRRRCSDCQRAAAQIAEVRQAVSAGGGLDDLARRRVRQHLAAQVDVLATLNAQRTRRSPWTWVAAAAAAVLLLGLAGLIGSSALDPAGTGGEGLQPAPPRATARLRPEGQARAVTSLVARRGAVRADVLDGSGRPRAAVTLHGPGRLTVERSADDGITLDLRQGLLLLRVQRGAESFRVRALSFDVEVKGTVFAVDARGPQLRVAVTRGVVAVRSPAGAGAGVMVRAGQGWQPTGGVTPASAALAALLEGRPTPGAVERRPAPDAARRRPATGAVERLYRRAEAAMREGRTAEATRLLADLTRRHPDHVLASAALYELADRGYRADDPLRARIYLRRLLAQRSGDRSLRDPAYHLLCRMDVEARRVERAIACLRAFRAAHPRSPHDQESLHTLAELLDGKRGCRAARPLWKRYLATYPRGVHALQVKARLAQCR